MHQANSIETSAKACSRHHLTTDLKKNKKPHNVQEKLMTFWIINTENEQA